MNCILKRVLHVPLLLLLFAPMGCEGREEGCPLLSPETAIFAFDFHDVIVHQNMGGLIAELGNIVWRADNKSDLFKDAFGIMKDSLRLKKELDVFDDVLDELVVRHPSLAPHAQRIHDVVNYHEPDEKMLDLIALLKKKGYRVYMVSNISPKALETMRSREPKTIGIFDAIYTAHQCRPNSTEWYVNEVKPHPLYYKGFRAYLGDIAPQDVTKTIIFIDDKQKNIDGARKGDKNLIGIRYKTIQQLKKDLAAKGILHKKHRSSMHVCDQETSLEQLDENVNVVIV